jgi:hypothetical protein
MQLITRRTGADGIDNHLLGVDQSTAVLLEYGKIDRIGEGRPKPA